MEVTRVCVDCDRELLISEFHTDASKAEGVRYNCKDCTNFRMRRTKLMNAGESHVFRFVIEGPFEFDLPSVQMSLSGPFELVVTEGSIRLKKLTPQRREDKATSELKGAEAGREKEVSESQN